MRPIASSAVARSSARAPKRTSSAPTCATRTTARSASTWTRRSRTRPLRRRTPSGAPPGRRNTQRGRTVWRTSGIGRRMLCPPADDAHGVPARCGKRVRGAVRVSAARERHAGRHRGARDEPRARVVGGRGAGGGDGPRPDHDDACDALLGGEVADVGGSVGDGARDPDGDVGGRRRARWRRPRRGRGSGRRRRAPASTTSATRGGADEVQGPARPPVSAPRRISQATAAPARAARSGSPRRRRRGRRSGKGAVGVVIRNTHHTYDGPSVNRARPRIPGTAAHPRRLALAPVVRFADRTRGRQPGHERRRRAPRGRLSVDRLARDVGQGAGPGVARNGEASAARPRSSATAPTRRPAPCAPAPRGPSPHRPRRDQPVLRRGHARRAGRGVDGRVRRRARRHRQRPDLGARLLRGPARPSRSTATSSSDRPAPAAPRRARRADRPDEDESPGYPAVRLDSGAGTDAVMAHLLGLGHRRIGRIAAPFARRAFGDREERWRAALADAGIDPTPCPTPAARSTSTPPGPPPSCSTPPTPRPRSSATTTSSPAACTSPHASSTGGSREDVSVVGFDDLAFTALLDPPLTTVTADRAGSAPRPSRPCRPHGRRAGPAGADAPGRADVRGSTGPPA